MNMMALWRNTHGRVGVAACAINWEGEVPIRLNNITYWFADTATEAATFLFRDTGQGTARLSRLGERGARRDRVCSLLSSGMPSLPSVRRTRGAGRPAGC